ncbi:amidohydrolase family protein [Stakelama tenebrarum]|uniref:Amidohydrolase family protein n=1 Tax=Stakelama tenebrarum TaxID=2711215 RepID=A0A6G6Y701_9SPHN|nr:amidohydrolase family protein [Sphingosinithalassobacter tenebrarum]QIG80724.1 amidohydrolase family protein [Sphingosinithalassobacter tenebrarum]
MLIRNAELENGTVCDIRIDGDHIGEVGPLTMRPGEPVIDAGGALLLPGLHDHHIHVAATAAGLASVPCGPPDVTDAEALAAALGRSGGGWLRGVGYHESVAGMLDAGSLDAIAPDRPVRIQHRSGRMWFLNSAALDLLLADRDAPPGMEREAGRFTGRLFDEDGWLRAALGAQPPRFAQVGAMLAARGVTGLTEISPANDDAMARHFAAERAHDALPQKVLLAGKLELAQAAMARGITLGPAKLHLHEADLPDFDAALAFMRTAHDQGRVVAVHCATEVELVFTLAAFGAAGTIPGDRIEHASVSPDTAVAEIARLGLAVVSQPHFVAERGDAYRADVDPRDQPLLYRLRAFHDAGVPLAGGSDAPYGGTDPWAAMAAAVSRQTPSGAMIGPNEALTPEEALGLYLAAPQALGERRRITPGAPADLCMLDRPWAAAREDLASVGVRASWVDGRQIFDSVDQAPV